MARVHGTRRSSSGRALESRSHERPDDDWLGEISDDDWSENAAERSERRRATPAYRSLADPADELAHDTMPAGPPSAHPVEPAAPRRSSVGRRRLAVALALALVLALGVGVAVLAARGGDEATTTVSDSTPETGSTTTDPSDTATTPTSPTTSEPATTTPGTVDAPAFSLPEGVKLQRGGDGDPALIRELQEALVSAGFDPGPADGTFGQQTEAAVVAFQQANGLSVDGRVGPETAEALNQALAGG